MQLMSPLRRSNAHTKDGRLPGGHYVRTKDFGVVQLSAQTPTVHSCCTAAGAKDTKDTGDGPDVRVCLRLQQMCYSCRGLDSRIFGDRRH